MFNGETSRSTPHDFGAAQIRMGRFDHEMAGLATWLERDRLHP